MAEAMSYMFTPQEVATALLKQQGIHEGFWGLSIEFGIAAANVPTDPSGETVRPAAIVPVMHIGIQRTEQATLLSVDAAEVNPLVRAPVSGERRKTGRKSGRQ